MNKSLITFWKAIQILVWLIGITILFCLFFYPNIGIHLFWDILIPIAPALLVIAPGLWRNICPMASTTLFLRHIKLSKQLKLSKKQSALLGFIAVIALYLIVPLRHILFNMNGIATGLLIVGLGIIAFVMGYVFEWKSGWCSSLCPIHPVEKLYGTTSTLTFKNAHCKACEKCVSPCPDSTPNIHPLLPAKQHYQKWGGLLLLGGFPGFIYGWFHVPDYNELITFFVLINAYKIPLLGFTITFIPFYFAMKLVSKKTQLLLIRLYAALAVSCYYWYRIPSLFGFGLFRNDGLLVDLTNYLSINTMYSIIIVVSMFFFWKILLKKQVHSSWLIRPEYIT